MTKRYFSEPSKGLSDILSRVPKDDLIILGLILFLIGDGCEDKELLLILGFLFLSDKINTDNGILSQLGNIFNSSN